MGLFSRKNSTREPKSPKMKVNLKGAAEEQKRMLKLTTGSNMMQAMQEAEPFKQAQGVAIAISQLKHKDQFGNEIVDPDRSNPTRVRSERPLDTIRSFERAIYNDGRDHVRRTPRSTSTGEELDGHYRRGPYDANNSQNNTAYRNTNESPRASNSLDNNGVYRQDSTQSGRNGHHHHRSRGNNENYGPHDGNGAHLSMTPGTVGTNGTHPDSYQSNGRGSANEHYSTDPSSESSSHREYDNYTTTPQKVSNNRTNPYDGTYGHDQQAPNRYANNGMSGAPNGSYGGHQNYQQGQPRTQPPQPYKSVTTSAWDSQPQSPKAPTKITTAASPTPEKRKSWFKRSKSIRS